MKMAKRDCRQTRTTERKSRTLSSKYDQPRVDVTVAVDDYAAAVIAAPDDRRQPKQTEDRSCNMNAAETKMKKSYNRSTGEDEPGRGAIALLKSR